MKTPAAKGAQKPPAESRRERFVRLAEGRTKNATDHIRLIGNLSNLHDYDFTEGDLTAIFGAIEDEIVAAKARFKAAFQQRDRRPVSLNLRAAETSVESAKVEPPVPAPTRAAPKAKIPVTQPAKTTSTARRPRGAKRAA